MSFCKATKYCKTLGQISKVYLHITLIGSLGAFAPLNPESSSQGSTLNRVKRKKYCLLNLINYSALA